MSTFKFRTDLADGDFEGTQLDILSSAVTHDPGDTRLLLENDDEWLVAYGDEVEVVEVEATDERGPYDWD